MITLEMPRPTKGDAARVTVCGRVRPEVAKKLETIAAAMRPQPTISALVALAVDEFVERHDKIKPSR